MKQLLFTLLLVVSIQVQAQQKFRIKAEYTTKEKKADGKSYLGKGTVYFDKNIRKIVYINTFPEKDVQVFTDTTIYHIVNKKVKEKVQSFLPLDFTVFAMTLNNNLTQFGLKEELFKLEKVEKDGDMVINTYSPITKKDKNKPTILVSTKNKQLFGVVILNADGKVAMKQFYKKYITVKGVEFPTEIIQITYKNDKENYQVNTYKNITVDEFKENDIYNFSIPAN